MSKNIAESAILSNDGSVTLSGGQKLSSVHGSNICSGRHCPIHNPSDHELLSWPLFFNGKHMYRELDGEIKIDPDDYYYNLNDYAIIRHSVKCLSCDDIIESTHRHDFQTCSCGSVSIDGGYDYMKTLAASNARIENLSIVIGKEV